MGGDEVNVILPGRNYGWPIASFGREYNGDTITDQPIRPGIESPRFFWVPSIGISGIAFYTGNRFPAWRDYMFVGGLSGMQLSRVRLQGQGTNERESLLTQLRHRIRDVRLGPDGLLYVVTDSAYDSPDNSGKVLRIEPSG
jgi:glucose/arabinose dehydrogenase